MTGRDRPETRRAMADIHKSLETSKDRPRFVKRLLNFQVFVTVLLLVLVVLTTLSFNFTMTSEREARMASDTRQALFEQHVTDILASVQMTQELGHADRTEIVALIRELRDLLAEHRETLNEHIQQTQ